MLPFILWYVIISLVGLAALPLTYWLLKALPDRGYGFARILGLLLWGYGYWMLGSLGVLQNDLGALLLTLGMLLALGLWALQRIQPAALLDFLRGQRRHVIAAEIVFLLAFGGWVLVRAANPEIFGTEKPMELAFINAIVKSPGFPPNDPWLSGYAISYYYFGYVLTAMLAQFTGLTAGVAFNLALALVFGLSALGAYSLVYNLLEARRPEVEPLPEEEAGRLSRSWMLALLGPIFVLLVSNLEGILEVLHARGFFWEKDVSGAWTSRFWAWLDIPQLLQTPAEPLTWLPDKYGTGSWWWWQASRVVQDYDLLGNWREVIDEFPFFSFLLADLHPHVLAIPFAFLAIALALNLYLGGADGSTRLGPFTLRINRPGFLLAGLVLGGLAFLNTWDFPMYVALFAGAYALVRIRTLGWEWARFWEFLGLGVVLGAAGVLLYLPFYIGFASQAGGILPNLIYPTRGAHLWVMFGLFFLPLFGYLLYVWKRVGTRARFLSGFMATGGLTLLLFLSALLLGGLLISLPLLESLGLSSLGGYGLSALRDMYLGSLGAGGAEGDLMQEAVLRRLISPGAWVTLFFLLTLTLGLLLPARRPAEEEAPAPFTGQPFMLPFFLLIVLLGALLVYGPEFFYLRDQFGWRINTIFKFYYQAWLIWGIAVAYGLGDMLRRVGRLRRVFLEIGFVLLVAVGLVYPALSLWDRTHGFNPANGFSLDGTQQGYYLSGDDIAAAGWLQVAPIGVVAEAVGGSYSQFARISANSGNPTVLGWPGHESQWRGGATEMGTRERDIEILFSTRDWREAERILTMYDIRYVYVGALERTTYPVNERKFQQHLSPVYSEGAVTIYEVP